jgi:hypothetical protein
VTIQGINKRDGKSEKRLTLRFCVDNSMSEVAALGDLEGSSSFDDLPMRTAMTILMNTNKTVSLNSGGRPSWSVRTPM